ncbi:MAG: hypothetical protein ACTHJR_11580, partial [Sphingomonas sp.]|uniref:hypothetical protein n=1 Tax=Sphingomonas sp. TaxID=28214 RepID=UPI003F8227E6
HYRYEGVNPAQADTIRTAAGRRTETAMEIGTIVPPTSSPQWVNVASGTPNFTANIGGTAAATVVSNAALGAQDPGTRINAAATLINPGKILISGASTLASWQNGGDNTKIEGGAIAANTITANKLTIGNRNVNVIDITFSTNGTTLSWTSGYVGYTNDAGTQVQASVSAGSTSLTGYVWVYWTQGATTLSATNTNPFSGSFSQDNAVTFCTWQSGQKWFVANYGTTIIDGSRITAASIAADRLVANSITSAQIAANTITADRMNVTSLSAITANLGAITAGSLNINGKFIVASDGTTTIQSATSGARLVLSGSTVEVYDASNVRRVRLGIW